MFFFTGSTRWSCPVRSTRRPSRCPSSALSRWPSGSPPKLCSKPRWAKRTSRNHDWDLIGAGSFNVVKIWRVPANICSRFSPWCIIQYFVVFSRANKIQIFLASGCRWTFYTFWRRKPKAPTHEKYNLQLGWKYQKSWHKITEPGAGPASLVEAIQHRSNPGLFTQQINLTEVN